MPKPIPIPVTVSSTEPDVEEEATVHSVYEKIAPHFAQTRFKPWPLIDTFLKSQPVNSIGLDSGAGNGKYLPVAAEAGSWMIALDRSLGLLEHAQKQPKAGFGSGEGGGAECLRGDLGCRAWRDGVFDFAISIAAIHHLSTPLRRRQAVQALLTSLKLNTSPPYSRFMLYVWAYEQGSNSRRKMGTTAAGIDVSVIDEEMSSKSTTPSLNAEEGKGKGDVLLDGKETRIQDVLVPWVLPVKREGKKPKQAPQTVIVNEENPEGRPSPGETKGALTELQPEPEVLHRYYHLFVEGELKTLVEEAGQAEGYQLINADGSSSFASVGPSERQGNDEKERKTDGKWLHIKAVDWEADNWWLEGEVGLGWR